MPPGFAEPPEIEQRPRIGKRNSTRRETILSLVDLLLKENGDNPRGQTIYEEDRDENVVDEQELIGAETFNKFEKRVNKLDKELRSFANASRQLGSSAAILSSIFHLRKRLAHILWLYRENAADLFPSKVAVNDPVPTTDSSGKRRKLKRLKVRIHAQHFTRPTVVEGLDLEDFPEQFELLAKVITTFANCLSEFPEFMDEGVDASIHSFDADLKYWASCLTEYKGQFKYPSVQRYLHDLSVDIGDHLENVSDALAMFVEIGVPTIRYSQKHGATNLLNLSTVATFFSAVTATTIQFSYELSSTRPVAVAVNSFWFASLVFSIASAVNSLLGLTWKQAMYRSPGHKVPWWVLIWIKRSPLVLLVMSVACFSIGLCCFAYATDQHRLTSTATTVFTVFTSFGLCAVSLWFVSERWTYLRHSGQKWLSDVLHEGKEHFFDLPGISSTRSSFHWARVQLRAGRKRTLRVTRRLSSVISKTPSESEKPSDDLEANALPAANGHEPEPPGSPLSRISDVSALTSSPTITSVPTPSIGDASLVPTPASETAPSTSNGRQLWKNAIRTVRMQKAVSSNLAANLASHGSSHGPRTPQRQRTTSSNLTSIDRRKTTSEIAVASKRAKSLKPKLRALDVVHDLPVHNALVKHLQFSPDGRFLATSSWDFTSAIFDVSDFTVPPRVLAHIHGRVHQAAWSPDGKLLLTKISKGIFVWTDEGVRKRIIKRPTNVESIVWFPGGNTPTLLSVEGSRVVKLNVNGAELDTYDLGKIKLHDVAVTPDGVRILGVGPLLESPSGLRPSKCRQEKRLVVFNVETKEIESQTPLVNDVRDVTISGKANKNGPVCALISYENKAPPQIWEINLVKDKDGDGDKIARPWLKRTYLPKAPVDFAGPSYFGGKNDELILCAGKAGDIHIWDQITGELLHHIDAQQLDGDVTAMAWNSAVDDPYMFATGSHDGVLRVWSRGAGHDATPRESIVRSASPEYDPEMMRTDSPLTQQEFESAVSLTEMVEGPPPSRERTIAFADETPPSESDERP